MNNEEKVQIALLVVDLEKHIDVKNLYIKGDSQIIINYSTTGDAHVWKIDEVIFII